LIYKRFSALVLMLASAVATAQNAPPATPPTAAPAPASTPVAAPPAAPRGISLDRVAAVVNDGIVLQSSLDRQVQVVSERLQQAGQQMPPRDILRQQVLERLIVQEIQMQRAARLGIKVPDEQLNETLTEVAQRNNVRFSDLPAVLEQQGIDYRSYREDMRREMILGQLRQRDVYSRIYVSPRELEQCVTRTQSSPADTQEYEVAHILISVPSAATPEQIEERTARAQGVQERARRGEDFADLAVAYSDGATALEGGKVGWRKADLLPSVVAELVPGMKPGDVTEVIRTPSGFNIFKLIDVRGAEQAALVAQVQARHILMMPTAVEDEDTVRQKLSRIRERVLKGEDFAAIASVSSADKGSATRGGDLGWAAPSSFAPEFARQVDALEINQISEPFKTQFGWHIVQLLGRRDYDATTDVTRNKCMSQLREARAEEETEAWARRLRDEAYVEYR
jgi:peptidyl-prolyl cis-trans isomerase SurA